MSLTTTTPLALALALAAVASAAPIRARAAAPSKQVLLGQKLVTLGGCNDCHTPLKMGPDGPAPDTTRLLSGHPEQLAMPPAPTLPEGPWLFVAGATMTAWSGPWGVSFTANLTPDAETGLGRWTEKEFVSTLRTGRHQGRGRALLPPMPIPAFTALGDDELKAIFAYLRSIPAVKNRVPEPLPPLAAR
jgi:mono/diheme cytochrome c family protein